MLLHSNSYTHEFGFERDSASPGLMPNFTLQKVEGCLDPVLEKVIMKMQEKQRRKLNDLREA